MSNSSLVSFTRISPNKTSTRQHQIDTITIHCTACQVTVERLGEVFAPASKRASSNYGVDFNGRVGMYVEEKDRSWASSNAENDDRSVTIEVASENIHPYAVTDPALASTIKLVADICKRNKIEKLIWSKDKNSRINHLNGCNMTVHRDYANKACPGEYLYSRQQYIADEVNKLLTGNVNPQQPGQSAIEGANSATNLSTSCPKNVKDVQSYLNNVMNAKLQVDGVYGNMTRSAICKYLQTLTGSIPDGVFGPQTLSKLPTIQNGCKGEAAKCMQMKLICLNIDIGSCGCDGEIGPSSVAGMKDFQLRHNLVADGIFGRNSWNAIMQM